MEKVVRVFKSFEEAEAADRAYYRSLTPEQRLEILFELITPDEGCDEAPEERLQRVYRITQRNRR